jgi:hypothetical protein
MEITKTAMITITGGRTLENHASEHPGGGKGGDRHPEAQTTRNRICGCFRATGRSSSSGTPGMHRPRSRLGTIW